ncbi:MAG: hypothetical protein OZ928_06245 [Polyangiaceae bacterium]|nr:hypothetical protein [Polyangiaceae bacterium]
MSTLSVIVPAPELEAPVRATLGGREVELLVGGTSFPELRRALARASSPLLVVLADRLDAPELIPVLVDRLERAPNADVALAARPRGSFRVWLAHLVAPTSPISGANGTSAMRREVAARLARVTRDDADLPALFARLDLTTIVLRDARAREPTARPSLALSGALVHWLVLLALLLYLIGDLGFVVLSPGVARIVSGVFLALTAATLLASAIVYLRIRRSLGGAETA